MNDSNPLKGKGWRYREHLLDGRGWQECGTLKTDWKRNAEWKVKTVGKRKTRKITTYWKIGCSLDLEGKCYGSLEEEKNRKTGKKRVPSRERLVGGERPVGRERLVGGERLVGRERLVERERLVGGERLVGRERLVERKTWLKGRPGWKRKAGWRRKAD